jgi:hypothetical protein
MEALELRAPVVRGLSLLAPRPLSAGVRPFYGGGMREATRGECDEPDAAGDE